MSALTITTPITSTAYLIGTQVSSNLFGINMLSGYETGDSVAGGQTYDDLLLALAGTLRTGSTIGTDGIINAVPSMRFPGGTLTEDFYEVQSNPLSINTPVGSTHAPDNPISISQFLTFCQDYGANMTFVMPTMRYLAGGVATVDTSTTGEIYTFITALLTDAFNKGVAVQAIELGNEWWDQAITATLYGKVASLIAGTVQAATDAFLAAKVAAGADMSSWLEPEILVQIGSRTDDDVESRDILAQFDTVAERSAVDGFVTHRYVTAGFTEINDPWVRASIYTFDDLAPELTGAGWKTAADMVSRVSEWNMLDGGTETGLKSVSTIVALFAEMTHFGVDAANFWSSEDRTTFSLTRHISSGTEGDVFLGLSFLGETFRMMNESLQGKTWLELYSKPADNNPVNYSWHGNAVDGFNNFDTNALGVEAFADDHEIVLFVSNRTGSANVVDLDLAGLIGTNYTVWATRVGVLNPVDALSQFGVPTIANFSGADFLVNGLMPSSITLAAWETMRITITVGAFGQTILGYTDADDLYGGNYADMIDGKDGNDNLSGNNRSDTIFGNYGDDVIYGNAAGDSLLGGVGKDSLFGGDGNDVVQGGAGDDSLTGGLGVDTLTFLESANITLNINVASALATGAGNDTVVGFENIQTAAGNDAITGSAGANLLDSRGGADSLTGMGGNDTLLGGDGGDGLFGGANADDLYGGMGSDQLFGGVAADEFWFATNDGTDVITDFLDGTDKIHFSSAGESFATLTFATVTGGVRVTHDPGDYVTVLGVTLAQLTAADFLFG